MNSQTIPQVELYPHNHETYIKICDMWKEADKAAAIQATGTGKTYLQLQCLYDFNEADKVVLAPSNYILDQLLAKSEGNLQNTKLLTYAKLSQMSLTEIEALKPSLIVLDEFHRCGADEWGKGVDKLLAAFPNAKILGTSATPVRYLDNARDMSDELFKGFIAVNSNLTDAIVRGILPMPKYVTALYTFDEEVESLQAKIANSSNDEDSKKALLKEVEVLKNNLHMSKGIPEILKKHISGIGGKYIVFCKDKAHLKEMEPLVIAWFQLACIGKKVESYRITFDDMGSKAADRAFRANENHENVRLMFSIEMYNEGIHIDDVTGVILLRPTVSPIIHFQQIGRSLQSGNTNQPLIFDFVNNRQSVRADDVEKGMKESVEREAGRRKASGESDFTIPNFTIYDETLDALEMFSSLEDELIDSFDANCDALEAYLKEHGEYPKKVTKLGRWVSSMRGAARGTTKHLLDQYRINRLNSIGFVWDVNNEGWESSFLRYAEIAKIDDHPIVEEKMRNWANNQRGMFSKGRMSQYRIDKLNSIEFLWKVFIDSWERDFKNYLEYIKTGKKLRYGTKLWEWESTQRFLYKSGNMLEYRISKLNSIGFLWDKHERKWKLGYDLLIGFKERNGHTQVPESYRVEGYNLANFVYVQRRTKRKGKLSQDRIDALNAIGFVWEVKESKAPND
jgi:superfamily II DNA or RNA helicase